MHSQHEINVVQLTPYAKSYYTVVSGSPATLLYVDIHTMESPVHEYPWCQSGYEGI